MTIRTLCALGVAVAALTLAAANGAGAAAPVEVRSIGTFDAPIDVAAPLHEDHLLFVVERAGRVRVVRDGAVLPTPFLDISGSVGTDGEGGLLSIAFPPRYWQAGRFVVYYVDRGGSIQLVEYRRSAASPELADPASARTILTIPHPLFTNHYGGSTAFGPDGLLYVGTGDGGGGGDQLGNARNLGSLLGKLLRIDPFGGEPYAIPDGNPFVGSPGARPEIFAFGLRNPWRFSFDRATGDLVIGDVGQGLREEVDLVRAPVPAGIDFGWNVFEASLPLSAGSAPGAVFPALEYGHEGGACSIIGGLVVRDPALASLAGRYLYADLCVGEIRSAALALPSATDDAGTGLDVPQIVSFGQDAGGCVYAVSLAGSVYRLAAPGAPAPVPCADVAPETTVTSAPSSLSSPGVALFAFASSEAGSSYECRVDDGAWSACPSPHGIALAGGIHVFNVRAVDSGGTADPTPARSTVTVVAPAVGSGAGPGEGSATPAPAPAPAPQPTTTSPPATVPAAPRAPSTAGKTARGTARADTLTGTARDDVLRGLGGNDRLDGRAGSDTLDGGAGNDAITGGAGRDRIRGGPGEDVIHARDGAVDTIDCGAGRDRVEADRGDTVARNCESVHRRSVAALAVLRP